MLLLGHESRLNRFQKLDSQISVNLTQGASTSSAVNFSEGASSSNSTAYVQPIQVLQNLPCSSSGSSSTQTVDAQAHLSQGNYNNSNISNNESNENNGNRFFNSGRGGCGYGGHNGGRSNVGRGDGCGRGRFANVQCQLCHKFGHEASFFYHRYEENYVATQPMVYENTQPLLQFSNLLLSKL